LLLLAVLGTGAGLWAVFMNWRQLMIERSQFLAGMIDQNVARGGYVDGMLIGLDALPDEKGGNLRQRALPWEPSTQNALDGAWRKWISNRGERQVLAGDTGAVTAVAFSPDGARMLTGSGDNTARLWDAATGKLVATLEGHTDAVRVVAFSPDGARVLTGFLDNTARLWPVFSSAQALVEEVKASAPRCLTPAQRESFHLGTPPPLWCAARHLWPFADAEPPAAGWDERLLAAWDRAAGWFSKARAGK
jgi:hypothetical protein